MQLISILDQVAPASVANGMWYGIKNRFID